MILPGERFTSEAWSHLVVFGSCGCAICNRWCKADDDTVQEVEESIVKDRADDDIILFNASICLRAKQIEKEPLAVATAIGC